MDSRRSPDPQLSLFESSRRANRISRKAHRKRRSSDVNLCHERDRIWLELDEAGYEALDASEGDCIEVTIDGRTVIGVMGTKARVWFTEPIDVDAAESIAVRRRRRV